MAKTGPSQKHGFGPDWAPRGSKSSFDRRLGIAPQARKEAEGRLIKGRCPGCLQAPRASTRRRPQADLVKVRHAPPRPDLVFGPMGCHMAPNGALTGSPGRELAGEAGGGVGLAQRGQKWTEQIGDPGRAGPDFLFFS